MEYRVDSSRIDGAARVMRAVRLFNAHVFGAEGEQRSLDGSRRLQETPKLSGTSSLTLATWFAIIAAGLCVLSCAFRFCWVPFNVKRRRFIAWLLRKPPPVPPPPVVIPKVPEPSHHWYLDDVLEVDSDDEYEHGPRAKNYKEKYAYEIEEVDKEIQKGAAVSANEQAKQLRKLQKAQLKQNEREEEAARRAAANAAGSNQSEGSISYSVKKALQKKNKKKKKKKEPPNVIGGQIYNPNFPANAFPDTRADRIL